MLVNNLMARLRRECFLHVARILFERKPTEEFNKIPYRMVRSDEEPLRCCIHCDRAVVRARILAALGFSLEQCVDEGRSLSEYANEALARTAIEPPFLTMLETACNSCVGSRFMVTNACQGCAARPCIMNCPKQAISMHHRQAQIDPSKCIGCGICVQVCPYSAIIKQPIPCENACPVDAIYRCEETGKERIDFSKCIHCGKCMTACPFGAMMERSQLLDVITRLRDGVETVAFFAPAIVAQFPNMTPELLRAALKKSGFTHTLEVAEGADITSQNEARELLERRSEGKNFMTTSCCPAYAALVQRHIPEMKPFVSETKSPMRYAAEIAKERYPNAVRVFIGPCLAKKQEAHVYGDVDFVLSMEELGAIFAALDVQINDCVPVDDPGPPSTAARGYALSGGVAAAVCKRLPSGCTCATASINGINKTAITQLKLYAAGKLKNADLLEVMACSGGCVAGPSVIANPKLAQNQLARYLSQLDAKPSESPEKKA